MSLWFVCLVTRVNLPHQANEMKSALEEELPFHIFGEFAPREKMKMIHHYDLQRTQEGPPSDCGLHSDGIFQVSHRPTEGYSLDAICTLT